MKRIVLILACICTLSGCSIDDDGSSLSLSLAEITDAQLPDYFETGEIYNFPLITCRQTDVSNFMALT